MGKVVVKMCGIGGVYALYGDNLTEEDAKRVKKLTVYLQRRGTDATGWFDGQNVIKMPLPAYEFISIIESITSIEEFVKDKEMILIHTRAYTRGSPLENKNNHPFELKDIVFAHNGIIAGAPLYKDIREKEKEKENKSKNETKNKNIKIYYSYEENVEYIDTKEILGKITFDLPETDSFHIGVKIQEEINKGKSFKNALVSALEELVLQGSMALWIIEKETERLALFRCDNPLFIAEEDGKVWFASENWMLKKIGLKNIEELEECKLVIYDKDGDIEEEYIAPSCYYSRYYYYDEEDYCYCRRRDEEIEWYRRFFW